MEARHRPPETLSTRARLALAPDFGKPTVATAQIGMMNWGLIRGKTQTYLPWSSWCALTLITVFCTPAHPAPFWYGAFGWDRPVVSTRTVTFTARRQQPFVGREPQEWFHDVFQTNGSPYREAEVRAFRKVACDTEGTESNKCAAGAPRRRLLLRERARSRAAPRSFHLAAAALNAIFSAVNRREQAQARLCIASHRRGSRQ